MLNLIFLQRNEWKTLTCDVFRCVWCLLVLFLFFWLYSITTVSHFKRRSQDWSFLSGCRVLDESQQKYRFFAEIQIHCKVFQLQPKRETSFSSLGDNEAFCAKCETRGGENSTPDIVGPTMLGVVICARVAVALLAVSLAVCSRCDLLYKLKFKSM